MENLYLIVFQNDLDMKKITDLIDSSNLGFWFYNMPHSVFLKSTKTPIELYEILDVLSLNRYIITKIGKQVGIDYYGRLPTEHWKHFK